MRPLPTSAFLSLLFLSLPSECILCLQSTFPGPFILWSESATCKPPFPWLSLLWLKNDSGRHIKKHSGFTVLLLKSVYLILAEVFTVLHKTLDLVIGHMHVCVCGYAGILGTGKQTFLGLNPSLGFAHHIEELVAS